MTFDTIEQIANLMQKLGATRLLYKILAANDNTKQQVYLGGSFDVVRVLPTGKMKGEGVGSHTRLKASLDFWWIDPSGESEQATFAQLILYPQYPEIRLSGFLRKCSLAPSELMSPKLRSAGRVLFLGLAGTRIYAFLVPADSSVARQALNLAANKVASNVATIFYEFVLPEYDARSARDDLLIRLRAIHAEGWIESFRLNGKGQRVPCPNRNCGGFTLEGKFGITPNSKAEPDFRGWELKAFSGSRITLLTPEPTLGLYGEKGVGAFLVKYGRLSTTKAGRRDFTGLHRIGHRNATTKMTLVLSGFDAPTRTIVDASGGVHLIGEHGELAAGWSYVDLLNHWRSKHALTAFIECKNRKVPRNEYLYGPTVHLAADAPFPMYLAGLHSGIVYYDPAPKSEESEGRVRVKARNQFRTDIRRVDQIFAKVETLALS